MNKVILITFMLFSSCHQCLDKNFAGKFNSTINKLELLKSQGITFNNNMDSVKIASEILRSLTGIRPHISYDYTVTYKEKDFVSDTSAWHKWYEENKCHLTEAMFDSIALKVRSHPN